jgi:deoxycytidylate deaminase
MTAVGYTSERIRLSDLMHALPGPRFAKLASTAGPNWVSVHMTCGNDLRADSEDPAALAYLAIAAIWKSRRDALGHQVPDGAAENSEIEGQELAPPREKHAYIIRSLKNPGELELLRYVYGGRLIVVGAGAPRRTRLKRLQKRLADRAAGFQEEQFEHLASGLIRRDENEPLMEGYGQLMSTVFTQADVFVDASDNAMIDAQVRRFVELLFGHKFLTPTIDEQSMRTARIASLRSAAMGRQVGAVIVGRSGSILSIGCNEVPISGGGQYWTGDANDDRDFQRGSDPNHIYKHRLLRELFHALSLQGWLREGLPGSHEELLAEALADPSISRARVLDILEYGRIVHAEMAALLDAALRGVSVADAHLYTTTFPCHDCAKHIVAAGIRTVTYTDPYPKNMVAELHGDSIEVDPDPDYAGRKVAFKPFVGVADDMFDRLFSAAGRKDGVTGAAHTWIALEGEPQIPQQDVSRGYLDREVDAADAIETIMAVARAMDEHIDDPFEDYYPRQ